MRRQGISLHCSVKPTSPLDPKAGLGLTDLRCVKCKKRETRESKTSHDKKVAGLEFQMFSSADLKMFGYTMCFSSAPVPGMGTVCGKSCSVPCLMDISLLPLPTLAPRGYQGLNWVKICALILEHSQEPLTKSRQETLKHR